MATPPDNSVMALKIKYQLKKQLAKEVATEVAALQEELNAAIVTAEQQTTQAELKRTHAQELQSMRAAVRLEERMTVRTLVQQLQNSWEGAQTNFLDAMQTHGLISPTKKARLDRAGPAPLLQTPVQGSPSLVRPGESSIQRPMQPIDAASADVQPSFGATFQPASQVTPANSTPQRPTMAYETLEQDMVQLVAPFHLETADGSHNMLEVSKYFYLCLYACMYVCIPVYLYVCMYVRMYVRTYVRTYTHNNNNNNIIGIGI